MADDSADPAAAAVRLLWGFADAAVDRGIAEREHADTFQEMLAMAASPIDLPGIGARGELVRSPFHPFEVTLANVIGLAAAYARSEEDDEVFTNVVRYGVVMAMRAQPYLAMGDAHT